MNDEVISSIINRIGLLLNDQAGRTDGKSLIYAEVEAGMYSVSVFVDRGETVDYIREPVPIEEGILDLWKAADEG